MAAHPTKQLLPFTEQSTLRVMLQREVEALKPERLQTVVSMALRSNQIVLDVFQSLLLVPEDDVAIVSEESEEDDSDDGESQPGYSEEEEAVLPYTEQQEYPSQEIIKKLELEGRVALERYMAQFKHRRTGNRLVDDFNGMAAISNKQQPSHKRNLSAYSDMPVQREPKKPSTNRILVARYATCQNCEKDFDVTENFRKACNYHDGELEIDEDSTTWDDWDENAHGPIDERLEKDFPEGFKWDCCEGDGNASGCQTSKHRR